MIAIDSGARLAVSARLRAASSSSAAFRFVGTSEAHNVSATGFPTVPDNDCAAPTGGPIRVGPLRSNRTTGGSLPLAGCLKKFTQYGGFSQNDTVDVWPLAVRVQVSFWVPKSFGTLIANTPC